MSLREKFIHAVPMSWTPRGQEVLHEPDIDPVCGFMTKQEVEIVSFWARKLRGEWLEIGSHTGWSACHIAAELDQYHLTCVDPALDPRTNLQVCSRFIENTEACGVQVSIFPFKSELFFQVNERKFTGIVIDGCHDAPVPAMDALGAFGSLEERGVIILHDSLGQPVQDAIALLKNLGMRVEEHDTAQGLTVCVRDCM